MGLTPDQMVEIMTKLMHNQIQFQQEAQATADKRMKDLCDELLHVFVDTNRANSEALREPDFQYMLGEAQDAFARSGSPAVKETLVDIIARRSQAKEHSREALTLNEAAARAPRLTVNEFAALSLCYVVRHTVTHSVNSVEAFRDYINQKLIPLATDVSLEQSSYWHIVAQSCGIISMGEFKLRDALVMSYGGLIGMGNSLDAYRASVAPEKAESVDNLLVACVRNPGMVQPNATNVTVFTTRGLAQFAKAELEAIWGVYAASIPQRDGLIEMLTPESPEIGMLFNKWDDSPIKHLDLNSVGIAIGHANAVRVTNFDAPLNVWIK